MSNMADGLGFQPRIGEPESSVGQPRERPQKLAGGPFAFSAPNIPDTSIQAPQPPGASAQQPTSWTYDFNSASGSARATFNGETPSGGGPGAGVTSWNGQTGVVVMGAADIAAAGGAPLASPALTGSPTAPTAAPGDSDTSIATTAFVSQAIANHPEVASFNGRTGAITLTTGDVTGAGGAPANNAALTGHPTAPTGTPGDNSSQIATDAFVAAAIAGQTVTSFNGRLGAVALSLSDVMSVGGAPIASPTFTGTPVVPTATPGTATGQAASTAFVTNAVSGAVVGVASFNTRTGPVVFTPADLASVGGAPLASPTFTGTPHAPTPSAGDNSTTVATTAFVDTAIASLPSGVATFNGRSGTVVLTLPDVTSVGGAPVASPTFTGSPITTTPPPGDNSTRIADTAFVAAAIAPLATTAALANYLPLAGGTLAGNLSGTTASFSGAVTPNSVAGVKGTTTNDNAAAGSIGEYVSAVQSTPQGIGAAADILTMALSAGDWVVSGEMQANSAAGCNTFQVGLNTVAATLPGGASGQLAVIGMTGNYLANWLGIVGPARFSLAAPTTIHLVAFAAGTAATATGGLWARRVR